MGLWSAQMQGRPRWVLPLAFAGVLGLGSLLGMAGIGLPWGEQGIAISVLALGLLLVAGLRLPLPASLPMVGGFALLHGYAHGLEMPADTGGAAYVAGLVLAAAMLQASGFGLAAAADRLGSPVWIRTGGVAMAVLGLCLLF